jgi:hypothetical protein
MDNITITRENISMIYVLSHYEGWFVGERGFNHTRAEPESRGPHLTSRIIDPHVRATHRLRLR